MLYDVIIIGSGPAGISASLYTVRSNLKTVVLGNSESSLIKAHQIENYYGFENGITGQELLLNGIKQAENLGAQVVQDEVVGILYDENYIVKTIKNEYEGKAIIFASGIKHKKSSIKDIDKKDIKNVSYCAICDGFLYRNKDVAVIGEGEYAMAEAEVLTRTAGSVTILTNAESDTRSAVSSSEFPVVNKRISSFTENDGKIEEIKFDDNSSMNIDGIFLAEGTASSTDFARKLGLELDKNHIKTDENMKTNLPGVFACGDCTGGLYQISKAVYEGTKAGLSAIDFLKKI